jgi:hypothetical protein
MHVRERCTRHRYDTIRRADVLCESTEPGPATRDRSGDPASRLATGQSQRVATLSHRCGYWRPAVVAAIHGATVDTRE